MFLRTLHTYILRELLRIFLMTASALTTLLAFGGTFKPFAKQGIDISQILTIMGALIPAMLAYAIPIAALFAAVLVYWRMSTDNELTACRAGGISFVTIVVPAFLLGLAVASIDLAFVNYVVPRYLQKAERAVMRDLGSIIVNQISRNQLFEYQNWVVYADSAELLPSNDPNSTVVQLHGAEVTFLDGKQQAAVAVARTATVKIVNSPETESSKLTFHVDSTSIFFPNEGFQRGQGSGDSSMFLDRPLVVPSQLRSKPKFFNGRQLGQALQDPWSFPPIAEVIRKIGDLAQYQSVAEALVSEWDKQRKTPASRSATGARAAGQPLEFWQTSLGTARNLVQVFATEATIQPGVALDRALVFTGKAAPDKMVRVEQFVQGKPGAPLQPQSTFTCDAVDTQLAIDELTNTGVGVVLQLRGHVTRKDNAHDLGTGSPGTVTLSGLVMPSAVRAAALPPAPLDPDQPAKPLDPAESQRLVDLAAGSDVPALQALAADVEARKIKLFQSIRSELHSRGSFAVSCLTLVLFGAALGILLRGKNPLAVFVVGFVPAVLLVLLITAGRELAEGSAKNENAGLMLIWLGNAVLLALVAGAYAKLLRH